MTDFETTLQFAKKMDLEDPLAKYRRRFFIPKGIIYLDGNSLGICSKDAEKSLFRVLHEWKKLGIRGWLEGQTPWFYMAEKLGEKAAALVGADPDEVVATGTTTINIHSLISTFFAPNSPQNRIIADELNFPSDIYALKSHLQLCGLDPNQHLLLASSQDGKTLCEDRIVSLFDDQTSLVYLSSVLYRSGQLLDMEYITKKAHEKGVIAGFDCCHSVGAVPHRFDEWGVDFAVWCGYKYLNSGPGCSAFLYINRRHFSRKPKLVGWFGYRKNMQFDMLLDFDHQPSAGGWQISSPGILGSSTIEGSLDLILEAGIDNIRRKSLRLTSYFIFLVNHLLSPPPYSFTIGTPLDPERRGGHVALERENEAWRICEALKARGVIPDFRPPNIIRIAPVALYNTFTEVWRAVKHLQEIIDNREYEKFSKEIKAVS